MKSHAELDPQLEDYTQQLKQNVPTEEESNRAMDNLQAMIANYDAAEEEQNATTKADSLATRTAKRLIELFNVPSLRIASSTAAAFAVVFSFLMFGGSTSTAFAAVKEQLINISSMQYSSEMTAQGQPFMRMQVYYREPGHIRVETQPLTENAENALNINVIDVNKGQGAVFFPGQKVAVPYNFNGNETHRSPKENPLYWLETLRSYQGKVKQLESQYINGVYATGFVIEESGVSTTVWANPETELPIKVIVSLAEVDGVTPFTMEADVKFNLSLNDELFSLTIDDDYQQAQGD